MKKQIKIKDKEFELFLPEEEITRQIKRVASSIEKDLDGKDPLFICVLNGAFMFASELLKNISIPCEIVFVRMASYKGTSSTGVLKEIYGLDEDIRGRTIVVIEDIVDTGHTISLVVDQLACDNPWEIKIATLLFKPGALQYDVKPDYVALEIPNDFVVGYGLDYNGYGRNIPALYTIRK